MTAFEAVERYLAPTRLQQALAALALPGGATILAGGTDLMPQGHAGRVKPAPLLLNIRRVEGLEGISVEDGTLVLGALVTLTALRASALVHQHAPLLAEAADHFASAQIRNAATLGGNLANASPAGDMLPPLIALDAQVELARLGAAGAIETRHVPVAGFCTGPGRTVRAADELIVALRVPAARPGQVMRFHKAGTRPALDISPIAIVLAAQRDDAGALHGVRIALGAVGPTPLRAHSAEAVIEGHRLDDARISAAAEAAAADAKPIDDVRASAWYRRELVRNMTKRMLDDVAAED
jgi:CO/xanthine dehydrogenase FAD-binding subunit